jgi:hypothetical protein
MRVVVLPGIATFTERIQSQEEKKSEVQLPISEYQPLVNLFRLVLNDKLSIEESSSSLESADTTKSSRDSHNLTVQDSILNWQASKM